jgi:hypothetical protein
MPTAGLYACAEARASGVHVAPTGMAELEDRESSETVVSAEADACLPGEIAQGPTIAGPCGEKGLNMNMRATGCRRGHWFDEHITCQRRVQAVAATFRRCLVS